MLILKDCENFQEAIIDPHSKEIIENFLERHRELFINHFIKEVRLSSQKAPTLLKIKVLFPFVSRIHKELVHLDAPFSENLMQNFLKFRQFGVDPDCLLQKLFRILVGLFVQDYRDDPMMMGHLSQLSNYFHQILKCFYKKMALDFQPPLGAVVMSKKEVEGYFFSGRRIGLFAHYKGVPVQYEGTVSRKGTRTITLIVPKEKGIVAEWEGRVLAFEKPTDPKGILMRVRLVLFERHKATLFVDGFAWVENFINRRRSVRVLVDKPIKATIKAGKHLLELDIFDLSTGGICLEGSSDVGLPSNELVEIDLTLPFENAQERKLRVAGTLRYMTTVGDLKRRYHIAIHGDSKKEDILANYIARLQTKRLQEIKETAQRRG